MLQISSGAITHLSAQLLFYYLSLSPNYPSTHHIYRHNGHYITLTNIYKANSIHDCLGLGYTHSIDAGIFKNKREDSSRRRREQGGGREKGDGHNKKGGWVTLWCRRDTMEIAR